jgi:EAL domain-containing protein (putative c-di-GMP-specific phosphodiesterase class I)/FixJ family two-component response regulator
MRRSVSNGRLLILDDDPAVGVFIGSTAAISGFDARAESDPGAFFQLLNDWSPTHIALDLVMPEMDGVEVLLELAKRKCKAKIIITSGVGGRVLQAARRSADEHGLNIVGVLTKPFLVSALRSLLLPAPETLSAEAMERARADDREQTAELFEVSEPELKRALASRELHLVYQPKIECKSGRLSGFEALARWSHPRHGLIMPDRFIPFAERSGLIDALTAQVLDQALEWLVSQLPDLAAAGSTRVSPAPALDISMSINLSAKTLKDSTFVDRATARCHECSIKPTRMIFELTETSAMEDPVASLALLTRMRMKGFHLSIDDFGTGYSSMLQLVRMPFSEIKVDKSFVTTAIQSKESRTVVRSIVDLGRSLGIQVVAEGVEDAETLEYLRQIGCDLAQGYFIGAPMQSDAIARWMARPAG